MLDLGGADTEGERAERAVRGGVRVAADDRHAGLRDAVLRPDDVHDALEVGADRVHRHAELLAVALERLDLLAAEHVADLVGARGPVGRDVVVGGREGAVGASDAAAGVSEALEGLGARHFMDHVQVDVDELIGDLVGGPDLVEQRGRRHGVGLVVVEGRPAWSKA